ncbi:MAG: AAA family ATPase [Rhizobiales bacterium]|nr:AAA family ATPase [Hyphomicrobiales bacterium]
MEQIDLERYGMFSGRQLAFQPDAMLHVIYGDNEAGKTSALSAIGDLLFGFSARTDYDFQHDAKTLRIGGRLRHSDGRLIAVRRRKGNKNTLVDENDQPLPDDPLAPLLGSLSREIFNGEFGLTARSLREGGEALLKAGGRLSETLAASSAGMSVLSSLRARLQSEADELFTPRRSGGKPFYLAADRRDSADRTLRDAIVTRDAVRQAEASVGDAQARLANLNETHAALGVELALWQRARRTTGSLTRLDAIAADLSAVVEHPQLTPDTLAEWEATYQAYVTLDKEISALDEEDAAYASEAAALAVDDRLLSAGPDIDALRERPGEARKARSDLPRRRQARDDAQAALHGLARRLGLLSHSEVLDRQPTDPAVALARSLIGQVVTAEAAIADAERQRAAAQQSYDSLATDGDGAYIADIAPVRQKFDALSDIVTLSDQYRRLAAASSAEATGLRDDVAVLAPSPGALEKLPALPLPDAATIAAHAHAIETAEGDLKGIDGEIASSNLTIAGLQATLSRLSYAGSVPTRADLAHARRERDAHLKSLRDALEADAQQRRVHLDSTVRATEAVDALADLLLSDTERAARQEDVQERLAEAQSARERLATQRTQADTALTNAKQAWEQAWAPLAIVPGSPAEMQRWREHVDGIVTRLRKQDAQKIEIQTLSEALAARKRGAIAFLEGVGRTPDETLAVDILFREAKARLDELNAQWAESKVRAAEKQHADRALAKAIAAGEEASKRVAELQSGWPQAMAGIGLAANATTEEAKAALDVWHAVPALEVSYRREGRSVDTMESDLQHFTRDVDELARKVAPSLIYTTPDEALKQLSDALERARRADETRRRLNNQAAAREKRRQSLRLKRDATGESLKPARQSLSAPDIESLRSALDRVAARHHLEADRFKLHRDLADIADGRDEAALRQEREGLDLDALPGLIERESVRHTQLLKEIEEASVALHQAKRELEALTAGHDAALAASERAAASAELLSIAERWLLRAAASRLATHAIERYRSKVEDPLVARAGALFAAATDGAFEGLRVDYGDDDHPILVAQRANGSRVPLEGLSEGTRDQLFLALRLALLERWPSEPIPFIGDDLLASFDDTRTFSTLRLLAAASEKRQILLFTHHRHVVNLAKSVRGYPVDVLEL